MGSLHYVIQEGYGDLAVMIKLEESYRDQLEETVRRCWGQK